MSRRGWFLTAVAALAVLLVSGFYTVADTVIAGAEGADSVQLLYFHRTQRCESCNNAEQYARETLDRYFPEEVKAGKLSIRSIDYQQDPAMAGKYGVKLQGLKIVAMRDGKETITDVPEVWALVKDKEACIGCLRTVLAKELGG